VNVKLAVHMVTAGGTYSDQRGLKGQSVKVYSKCWNTVHRHMSHVSFIH